MSVSLNVVKGLITEQQRWDPERKAVSSSLQKVKFIRRMSLGVTMDLKRRGRALARNSATQEDLNLMGT